MARDFNGSTDRLDYGSPYTPSSGSYLTVAAWVYIDDLTSNQYIWGAHQSGDAAYGHHNAIVTSEVIQYINCSTGYTNHSREGTGGISGSAWEHLTWVKNGGYTYDYLDEFVDGALPGTENNIANGSGGEDASVGSWSLGGRIYDDLRNYNGRLAEVGVWDRALSSDEIAALAKGYSPLHFRNGLKFYAPLIRDPNDLLGETATLDGTTVIEHPPILYPG